ncbi:SH3 domain-containing protein [Arenibacter nanhaiticus]|uniref:SH3 domain-containing protein n=1 Tax=Arenibacter nanhaiticus TaxID=558155 RepID=A0A1M6LU39_9FLAO|nr:SH3 domain-containing C40 family peptidase [Arenibacter nanhaiticus]SHJ74699.1 SH3 domain-containing protein [Arenibacter nanhaiticus]
MTKKQIYIGVLGLFLGFFMSCKTEINKEDDTLNKLIGEVKENFAPDKRVALFDISFSENKDGIILKGESDMAAAVDALKQKLDANNIRYIDSVQHLPAISLAEKQGLITISVANLRGKAAHSSELVTQATLGTPVKILKNEGDWLLVQTPDNYLSWVDRGGVKGVLPAEFSRWKSAKKIIFLSTIGHAYTEADVNSQVVSDMVAGAILEFLGEEKGFFKVQFPDGREAFVNKKEAMEYDRWLDRLDPSQESLVNTAKSLMGVPYLWGGTSTKGVDCSGFTKSIYFLNGIVLPRDASQQIHTGKQVDAEKDFDKLVPGDLLFFGKPATDTTKERVIHVGMWIGNNEFIHSAGRVHISSMDKDAPNYDAYNYNRYLRSNRYLNEAKDGLIELVKTPVFKD